MTIDQKSKIMMFPKIGKFIIIFFSIAFIVAGVRAYQLYRYVFEENVKNEYVLIIPENATYGQVTDSLVTNDILISVKAFKWVAKKKNYPMAIKPGRYLFEKGMNSNEIVNMLRGGLQEPIDVTFNNVHFKEDLAGKVSKYIQADSLSILNLFYNNEKIKEYGFSPETFRAMFIPNTYEFYWTTSADEFADRMKLEYERFWNEERRAKAAELNLTPVEVITLASIVQSETSKKEELPVIAGLYINRLKRGQLLQADPTVKYAVGDFSLKRILNRHLEIESPYNTYKYVGLPPGPINFPETATIDAVLNYEKHNYIYMCAKPDFSGYHNFSATLAQHNRNAAAYRAFLNANKIYQ
ncbi:endolytic transglycosylase MltG [Maribellus comscasis]|uniref:Endolytic murein transglycosylase n=1 Tax=Maribellus comscasis TaxID=2681766 RepID=A0A6I6JJJ9_9BACT|nr:endolytic transglycosylase MltG [Maribellus comscasis]QGY42986.1 endolytic transglycosylase MltG [Maribellus comscasis]